MKKAQLFSILALVAAFTVSATFISSAGQLSDPEVSSQNKEIRQKRRMPQYKEGELLVKFRPGVRSNRLRQINTNTGLRLLRRFPRFRLRHMKITAPGLSVPMAVKLLNRLPEIEYAEPNYIHRVQAIPVDPHFHHLWGLNNTGQTGGAADADIDAAEAWDIVTGDPNVVVAVIDTGVDYTHGDLAHNMWINPLEIPRNGLDDDDNGYIDDIYGIDAVNDDSDPMDDYDHGTHVAGTIGAIGDNGFGVSGVNWDVRIMALKFLGADGFGSDAGAIECLNYVTTMKEDFGINIKLTNNSWGGGGFSESLSDAIQRTAGSGILFVAAAGNNASDNDLLPFYPASYSLDNIISVAASDHNDRLASFSNFGLLNTYLTAPGVDILSTTPSNTFDFFSGTSMAAPHVSGVAALLWADDPSLTYMQVKERILGSVDEIPNLHGRALTAGRLNALNALTCDPGVVTLRSTLKDGFVVGQGVPTPVAATLSVCDFLKGADASADFSNGDPSILLTDDGVPPDHVESDGVYTGLWTPITLGATTVTVSATQAIYNIYNLSVAATGTVREGYLFDDLVPFNWIDLSASQSANAVYLANDGYVHIDPSFQIEFYDSAYSGVSVSSDGRIYFDDLPPDLTNECIPSELASGINTFIAPFWDDLNPDAGGIIYWETRGQAPNRTLIIQYDGIPHAPSVGDATFEVIFFEGSNDVLVQYLDVDFGDANYDLGASATVGLQRDIFFGQQYSCSQPMLADNTAILWYLRDYHAPGIALSPASLSNSVLKGGDAPSQSFDIWNYRVGTLSYSLACAAQWVYCTPRSGTSTGEIDTIDVRYSTSGLSEGNHFATIEINDPNAVNSPQFVGISLTVIPDTFDLVTDVSPVDTGVVTGSGAYFDGEVVTVEAFPNACWAFDRWEGGGIDGSTANPEQITMNADTSVIALFVPVTYTLTTQVSPGGTGTISGGGAYACEPEPLVTTIEAFPNSGWVFLRWEGDITGSATENPKQITMDADKVVTAVFGHTLTVNVSPVGAGTVTGAGLYRDGQVAPVQAFSNFGWVFSHWSGAEINGSISETESVTMDSDKTVTAEFYDQSSPLTRIDLSFPQNEAILYSAPVFTWMADGGTNNRYAVDLTLDWTFGPSWSTLRLGPPLSVTTWQMPQAIWNAIPSGSYVYWRVRGADINRVPRFILGSSEFRWFYKY